MKLKDMVPSGKQLRTAKKAMNVAGKVMPSRNGGDDEEQQEGVGDGRRMPIQQSVDVAVPVETAWKLWNKYEDYPKFMHRLESVEKIDPKHVRFTGKIWGISRSWEAKIIEKRRPAVVLLENVRNLAGPRHRHEWEVIIRTLREFGYRVADEPAPSLLHRRRESAPQLQALRRGTSQNSAASAEGVRRRGALLPPSGPDEARRHDPTGPRGAARAAAQGPYCGADCRR